MSDYKQQVLDLLEEMAEKHKKEVDADAIYFVPPMNVVAASFYKHFTSLEERCEVAAKVGSAISDLVTEGTLEFAVSVGNGDYVRCI